MKPLREADFSACSVAFPAMMGRLMKNPADDAEALAWLSRFLCCQPMRCTSLARVYAALPAMSHEERRKAKQESLPACVPAGVFDGSHKREALRKLSGVMVFDFDGVENAEEAARRVARLPFIEGAAPSCSHQGVYAWTHLSQADEETYRRVVCTLLASDTFPRLCGLEADPACKDVCRARYLSPYRPVLHEGPAQCADLWLNTQPAPAAPAPLLWSKPEKEPQPQASPLRQRQLRRLTELCRAHRLDLTRQERQWFILLGVYARAFPHDEALQLAQTLSSLYPAYNPEETRRKFEHAFQCRAKAWTPERLFSELSAAGIISAGWRAGLLLLLPGAQAALDG